MRLNTLIRRVERLRDDIVPLVKSVCERKTVERWIVESNREQLQSGKNANGVMMGGGVYSVMYRKVRARRGLPTDHVYLSFEGDLQNGMKVLYSDTGFSIVSTDWKQRLVDEVMRTGYWPSSGYNAPEYGPVFGLTAEKKGELARLIAPIVAGKFRNRLLR